MFYYGKLDNALRFGDILKGYVLVSSDIKDPKFINEYVINVNVPSFSVIISPCCSIGDKSISLTPLIKVRKTFFDNPYLSNDLTRINRKMKPEEAFPPHVWEGFPPEEKDKRLNEGEGYAFLDCFIYDKNEIFPEYTINRREGNFNTNYYMIDFRNIYKINCDKIINATNSPLENKCLQLSIQTRDELRNKLSYYYWRPPKEDLIEMD